jgi:hypothetical protein
MLRAPTPTRRIFLGALAAGAACALVPRLAHAGAPSRVRSISRDERGITAWLELENAPFPAPGAGYRDNTVVAFVPHHFRFSTREQVQMLVHFHGHNTTVERALTTHALREQLFDSKQNAILLAPQGPVASPDSSIGKLEASGGFARFVADALAMLARSEVRSALGPAGIPSRARAGNICISAHSGGYHATACALRHGGLPINEVYLFDALYNESDVFRDWVIEAKGRSQRSRHKLVSYYTEGTTEALNQRLAADLEKAGVACARETVEGALSRAELTRAEAVFIRTGLSHGGVTHELNGLRDCLFASGLARHIQASWFAQKDGARRLERRR